MGYLQTTNTLMKNKFININVLRGLNGYLSIECHYK